MTPNRFTGPHDRKTTVHFIFSREPLRLSDMAHDRHPIPDGVLRVWSPGFSRRKPSQPKRRGIQPDSHGRVPSGPGSATEPGCGRIGFSRACPPMEAPFTFRPIGHVRSGKDLRFKARHQPDEKDAESSVLELEPWPGMRESVRDLEGMERIWIVWVFHRAESWRPLVLPPRVSTRDTSVVRQLSGPLSQVRGPSGSDRNAICRTP